MVVIVFYTILRFFFLETNDIVTTAVSQHSEDVVDEKSDSDG
jgi:hypothetical protein